MNKVYKMPNNTLNNDTLFLSAIIDKNGNEKPITEAMIQEALSNLLIAHEQQSSSNNKAHC